MSEYKLSYPGEKINELLGKADTALQQHQDISHLATKSELNRKQDAIPDLAAIRSDAAKGATALQSVPDEYVTETELNSKGYLTEIPSEYITESELDNKGFLTEHQDISQLATKEELASKQDTIEDLETIREEANKIAEIVDENGYLLSNGEKVDMRFTRSLLPIGTSIPAKANLNTKTYLKIGKYYCSLNADAKTITNCPVNVAFSLEVFNPLGTNVDDEDTKEYTYRMRVLTQYDTGQQYTQFCRTSGTPGTWTYDSWYITTRAKFTLNSSKNDGSAAVGSATQGAYVDSTGTLTKMTYTLGKSVPSSAVFTDTKVTAVGNHYTPEEDETAQINAPEGECIVGLNRDAAGHVVGVVSVPYTMPDEYVTSGDLQEAVSAIKNNYPITTVSVDQGMINMLPNKYYRDDVEVTGSVTLVFHEPTDATIVNEYIFEFYASSDSVSLSLPGSIVWANDDVPEIEEGYTYVISVVNNVAVYIKTPHNMI